MVAFVGGCVESKPSSSMALNLCGSASFVAGIVKSFGPISLCATQNLLFEIGQLEYLNPMKRVHFQQVYIT